MFRRKASHSESDNDSGVAQNQSVSRFCDASAREVALVHSFVTMSPLGQHMSVFID